MQRPPDLQPFEESANQNESRLPREPPPCKKMVISRSTQTDPGEDEGTPAMATEKSEIGLTQEAFRDWLSIDEGALLDRELESLRRHVRRFTRRFIAKHRQLSVVQTEICGNHKLLSEHLKMHVNESANGLAQEITDLLKVREQLRKELEVENPPFELETPMSDVGAQLKMPSTFCDVLHYGIDKITMNYNELMCEHLMRVFFAFGNLRGLMAKFRKTLAEIEKLLNLEFLKKAREMVDQKKALLKRSAVEGSVEQQNLPDGQSEEEPESSASYRAYEKRAKLN